jgi:hypothetical protein
MSETISREQARQAARDLKRCTSNPPRQWDLRTAIACLPAGWTLPGHFSTALLMDPMTIGHMTEIFRDYARPVDARQKRYQNGYEVD